MKIKSTILMFIAAFFIFGSANMNGQTEVWNEGHPDWNATGTLNYNVRGIAQNADLNHLYIGGNTGVAATAADNKIFVLDASTGGLLKTMTLEPLSLVEMGYGIKDVETDDAGGIFAISSTANYYHPLKVFYWANEDANPQQLWVDLPRRYAHSLDFSGGFSVKGDFNTEALIAIPMQNEDSLFYFEATNGVLGDINIIGLDVAGHAGTYAQIDPLGSTMSAGFWYNNSVLQTPTKFDGSGNIIGSIDPSIFTGTTGGVKQFTVGMSTYLAISNAGNIVIIDITGAAADFSDVDATNIVTTIAGTASPASSYLGYGQEECMTVLADGSYVIYSLSGYRYTKKLATESAPLVMDLELTGVTSSGETVNLGYTYIDHNNDLEGTSEIKWYLSDDDQGTNKTEIVAAANASSYTILAADDGKYLSFSVLPIAQTGTISFPGNLVESAYYGPILSTVAAPVASNIAISGDLNVYSALTGSYDYTDENSDLEGVSILKWYAADDAMGSNPVMLAENNSAYTLQPADENKFIIFSVTPVALTGGDLVGDSVGVVSATAVIFPAFVPTASDLAISGREEVAGVLTGSYSYEDLNSDLEGTSVLKWYRADDDQGTTNRTEVASGSEYTVVAADEGKYIVFEVTPVTENAESGDPVSIVSAMIAAEPAQEAPIASDVMFHGLPEVGVVVYGTYTYSDRTDDPEGSSIHKWFTADDAAGANKTQITGADGYSLIVTEDMIGKYLLWEVTPVATVGGLLEGTPVEAASSVAAVADANDGDFERVWMRGVKNEALPEFMGSGTTERGFAVGNDHVYIASRKGGTNLIVADAEDGSFISYMNTDGMDLGLFKIQDVEVSDDGQILACPLVLDATAGFVVYKWENEFAAPTKFIEYTSTEAMRFDKFTVEGDVSSDAVVFAVAAGAGTVVRWEITGGIVQDPVVITLANTSSSGVSPSAAPFSASADANFIVAGRTVQPQIFDKDGNQVMAIEGISSDNNQANAPKVFEYKGRTLAAFHEKVSGMWNVIIIDITGTIPTVVGRTEILGTGNDEQGDVSIFVEEGYFHVFYLATNGGVARYKGFLELPEYAYSETNEAGDKLDVNFSKSMATAEGYYGTGWTVMAAGSEVAVDSIYPTAENELSLTFDLATAVTNGQAVTIAYDGTGVITAFDGMPLNAIATTDVVNIVGVAVPTASDVAISGTERVGETFTATYTYEDADSDLEGTSLYQWWYASDAEGSDALKILGEKAMTYVVGSDVEGKYIAFEVTPVAATGGMDYLEGAPVMSAFVRIIPTNVDNASLNSIRAYPNPVRDILTIDNASTISSITVIDVTGKQIRSINTDSENLVSLNMSSLNNGIYYLKLKDESGSSSVIKVVKVQ